MLGAASMPAGPLILSLNHSCFTGSGRMRTDDCLQSEGLLFGALSHLSVSPTLPQPELKGTTRPPLASSWERSVFLQ